MPFFQKKDQIHVNEVIVRREIETVREVPVFTGSMDSLVVQNLTITGNICVPDVTRFHPPDPHIVRQPYLEFNETNTVGFKANGRPFLQFDHSNVYVDKLCAQTVQTQTATIGRLIVETICTPALNLSLLRVDRIEAGANIIGGVVLRDGGISAPGNLSVGSHLIAVDGTVGEVSLRENRVCAHTVDASIVRAHTASLGYIETERIRCTAPYIVMGGVHLMSGDVTCGRLETTDISALHIRAETVDCPELRSSGGIRMPGISTPPDSVNYVGRVRIAPSGVCVSARFTANDAVFDTVDSKSVRSSTICAIDASFGHTVSKTTETTELCATSLSASNIHTGTIACLYGDISKLVAQSFTANDVCVSGHVKAADFRLPDGTSILNGVFPVGMIMLFNGKTPPRGWLECNGKGGTPCIPGPVNDVIYVIRR